MFRQVSKLVSFRFLTTNPTLRLPAGRVLFCDVPSARIATNQFSTVRRRHFSRSSDGVSSKIGVLDANKARMTLVFTCNVNLNFPTLVFFCFVFRNAFIQVCETRTAKTFSKQAYEKGAVAIQCPECKKL